MRKANLTAGGAPMQRIVTLGSAAKIAAMVVAAASLGGCAQLHLTQGPDQVIQRTEGADNYDSNQNAGPTAARILPYALLAEQSYDRSVYAQHRMTPRAGCASNDPKNCESLADSKRAAQWLSQWRYVWSCEGPDECKVRTPGETEPVGGLGVQIWARKGARCPEAVIAFRGTMEGNKGDWESNFHWILRAFPVYDQYYQVRDHIDDFIAHIERDKCFSSGSTQITAVGHSLGGGLAQLAAYADRKIRRVYAFDPSMVTGYYSVDPTNRNGNVKGLRMERVYEHGEILAYARYFIRQYIPLSPCDPRVVSVRFDVIHGSPIAQHSLTDFDNGLLREARGFAPETSPMVDERCGVDAPGGPIAAAQ
jgi:pimeloyl-ACP methyl ester carboxylesterase